MGGPGEKVNDDGLGEGEGRGSPTRKLGTGEEKMEGEI